MPLCAKRIMRSLSITLKGPQKRKSVILSFIRKTRPIVTWSDEWFWHDEQQNFCDQPGCLKRFWGCFEKNVTPDCKYTSYTSTIWSGNYTVIRGNPILTVTASIWNMNDLGKVGPNTERCRVKNGLFAWTTQILKASCLKEALNNFGNNRIVISTKFREKIKMVNIRRTRMKTKPNSNIF